MNKWLRIGFLVLIIPVVAALWILIIEPFVPTTFGFHAVDPVEQARYEEIVWAHGYEIRYETNVRGEMMAFIDRVTPREYKTIDCEYFTWSAQRHRAMGVIVYDREDCEP